MAEFNTAFESTIRNEGGYKLHKVDGDRGGQTYAGIARKFWPGWNGWSYIDRSDMDSPELSQLVRGFFYDNFWQKVKGNDITSQSIASDLYDFAVNSGVKTAVKIAQVVVHASPDGVIGPNTLKKINGYTDEIFMLSYALAKIARYTAIANSDKSQRVFLRGWINRVIGGLK